MSNNIVYERDLLYSVGSENDLGVVHLEVMGMGKSGKVQVIIENKSKHSAVEHIDTIIDIMQKDVFDRLDVNVTKNVDINIKISEEDKKNYDNKKYLKITFNNGEKHFEGVDEINI